MHVVGDSRMLILLYKGRLYSNQLRFFRVVMTRSFAFIQLPMYERNLFLIRYPLVTLLLIPVCSSSNTRVDLFWTHYASFLWFGQVRSLCSAYFVQRNTFLQAVPAIHVVGDSMYICCCCCCGYLCVYDSYTGPVFRPVTPKKKSEIFPAEYMITNS